MPNLYHDRTFLNDEGHGGLAAVVVKASGEEALGFVWCEMAISDCHRSIELQFSLASRAGLNRSIRKIRRLKEVCARFEEYLNELQARVPDSDCCLDGFDPALDDHLAGINGPSRPIGVMGPVDYLHCAYPLPDAEVQDLEFETMSFDRCHETYLITRDGRLVALQVSMPLDESFHEDETLVDPEGRGRDIAFHGDVSFYAMDGHGRWFEYEARFTEGQITRLKQSTKLRGPSGLPPTDVSAP